MRKILTLLCLIQLLNCELADAENALDCPDRVRVGEEFNVGLKNMSLNDFEVRVDGAGKILEENEISKTLKFSKPGDYEIRLNPKGDSSNIDEYNCQVDVENPRINNNIAIRKICIDSQNEGRVQILNKDLDNYIDISSWVLYSDNYQNEYFINSLNIEPDILIPPNKSVTINIKEDSDFNIYNQSYRIIELFDGPIEMMGQYVDRIEYPDISIGECYSRFPELGTNFLGKPEIKTGTIVQEKNIQSNLETIKDNSADMITSNISVNKYPDEFIDPKEKNQINRKKSEDNKKKIGKLQNPTFVSSVSGLNYNSNNSKDEIIASSNLENKKANWLDKVRGNWIIGKFVPMWLLLWSICFGIFVFLKKLDGKNH